MIKAFRASTILLVLALFTVGSLPATGHAFPGQAHLAVHLSYYALISFCLVAGWQIVSPMLVIVIVSAIGFLHETTEIITHSHAFELNDALVNAFGAAIGIMIFVLFRRIIPHLFQRTT